MAKALLGAVGRGPDVRLVSEMRRLRDRVRDLESELDRLRVENTALAGALAVDEDMISLSVSEGVGEREPALT